MTASDGYYIGDIKKDAIDHGDGWVVGTFMPEGLVQKTSAMEIKYWHFEVGKTKHLTKTSATIECTIILEGESEGLFGDQIITLKKGQYFVIKPGTINNFPINVVKPTTGITIKAPSDVTAKKIVTD